MERFMLVSQLLEGQNCRIIGLFMHRSTPEDTKEGLILVYCANEEVGLTH